MTLVLKVWLTRDSFEGENEPFIDVWASKPERHRHVGDEFESLGVTWFDIEGGIEQRLERLSLAAAARKYRTIPDDDRQCVVVG